MKNYLKNSKAITLIALIITIVILIILAGVTISLTLGNNGLFNKAKTAKQTYTEASISEKAKILMAEYELEKQSNSTTIDAFFMKKIENGYIDDFVVNGDNTITLVIDGYSAKINTQNGEIVEGSIDRAEKLVSIHQDKKFVKLGEKVTLTVKFGDGIDVMKCKWEFTNSQQNLGASESDKTKYTGTFTNSMQTIEQTKNEAGDYYLHVLVVYKDSNIENEEKISNKVTYNQVAQVTYQIDENTSQIKEIVFGDDIIEKAPQATKNGYTFTGWREDTTASSEVLNAKSANAENITLNAVFEIQYTATFIANGATSGSANNLSAKTYYNNGNITNGKITLPDGNSFEKNNNKLKGFSTNQEETDETNIAIPGSEYSLSEDTTLYAQWAEVLYLMRNGEKLVTFAFNRESGDVTYQERPDNENYIYISSEDGGGRMWSFSTANAVNLSGYSKVCFDIKYTYCWNGACALRLGTATNSFGGNYGHYKDSILGTAPSTSNDIQHIEINVSSINDLKYIALSGNARIYIYNIWVE